MRPTAVGMICITYAYRAVIDYNYNVAAVSQGLSCDERVLKVKGKYTEAAHCNSE